MTISPLMPLFDDVVHVRAIPSGGIWHLHTQGTIDLDVDVLDLADGSAVVRQELAARLACAQDAFDVRITLCNAPSPTSTTAP